MHDAPREDPADVANANEAPGSEEAGNEEYVPQKQMLKKYTNKEFVFASRRYPLPTLTYQKMAQAHKEEMRLLRQERKHEQKLIEKQRQRLKRQQAQFNRRQRERREREEHFEETMRQKTEEAEMHRLFARQVTHDSLAREGMSGMSGGGCRCRRSSCRRWRRTLAFRDWVSAPGAVLVSRTRVVSLI